MNAQALQVKHVNWRPITLVGEDGVELTAYEIRMPPALTKGSKSSGKFEVVYAVTNRFRLMLDQRRLQLKNTPEAYLFGTEAAPDRSTSIGCGTRSSSWPTYRSRPRRRVAPDPPRVLFAHR